MRRRVDPAVADDVVGDILLRLVRHRDTLVAANNSTAWVMRVAANAVSDHYRSRAVERWALSQIENEAVVGPAAADNEAGAEIAGCLVPMIRSLPAIFSQTLLLTDIEGLTHAAAGHRLGLSVSGVKSRVRRGRAKLRDALLSCCTIEMDRRGGIRNYRPRGKACCSGR